MIECDSQAAIDCLAITLYDCVANNRGETNRHGLPLFQFRERFGVGSVFVHVDDAGLTVMRSREDFEKEALGRLHISGRIEPEIERVVMRINCTIKVHPFFFTFMYVSSTRQESVVAFT